MRKRMWAYLRQVMHAFAEAGQPAAQEFQQMIGPNGPIAWTWVAQVDRRQPFSVDVPTTAPSSPMRISHEPLAGTDRSGSADEVKVREERIPQPTGAGVLAGGPVTRL
jgi:hypothetical protein